MSTGRVGLSFRAEADPTRIEQLAGAASRFSFPALSVWDDLGDPPPAPLLLELAKRDRSAKVGFACLAVPKYATWDGVVGLLALLAAGREGPVFVGLAAGAWLNQVGLEPAGVRRVAEAAAAIRYLLGGRTEGLEGRYYSVAPGFRLNYALPESPPGLMIGAWGERLLHLAGEIADEVKVGGTAGPETAALAKERIAPGATAAGRDPRSVGVVMGAVTIVDDNREAALREARRRAATYIPVVGALDPVAMDAHADAIEAVSAAMAKGDVATAMQSIPDGLLSRFAFAGNAADVIRQVEACIEAEADRVDFGSPHGLDPIRGIEIIGEKVLPHFR
jgi:5,10-methylenetetrahydromethanopterin reductase